MKFLQIWLGDKFPDRLKECIESVRSLVRQEDEYIFISDRYIEGIKIKPYIEVVKELEQDEKYKDLWMKFKDEAVEGKYFNKFMSLSNFLRLYYGSKYNDLLYCDTDIYLKNIPNFPKKDIPYIGKFSGVKVDFFIFYTNESRHIFRSVLEETKKHRPRRGNLFFIANRILRLYEKVNIFDENSYEHKSLSFKKISVEERLGIKKV